MTKSSVFLFSLFMSVVPPFAYSADGPYVSGALGVVTLKDVGVSESGYAYSVEPNTGAALGLAAGYEFESIRVEGEITYQQNDMNTVASGPLSFEVEGDMTSLALMLNGYYDFENKSPFTPFIGMGIGFTQVEVKNFGILGWGTSRDEDDIVFAHQVGAGVGYAINEKTSFDINLRYFETSDPGIGILTKEYSSQAIYAAIRFSL